eukprot:3188764-Pleurochrysis_carterae.AAC.1
MARQRVAEGKASPGVRFLVQMLHFSPDPPICWILFVHSSRVVEAKICCFDIATNNIHTTVWSCNATSDRPDYAHYFAISKMSLYASTTK